MQSGDEASEKIEAKIERCCVTVSVNPRIYPLDVVYYAAYVFIDKAYVIIYGDPKKEILVELRPKEGCDLEALQGEFNNELLNYTVYLKQANRNQKLREAILQRVLMTNTLTAADEKQVCDPEGIALPCEAESEG